MWRILIIEDDAVVCKLLADALRRDWHLVAWHNDPHQALAHASKKPVDLAILGVGMPQIDGFDLLRNLRAQYPSLPVIMVTAFGSIDTAVQAVDLGAVDYISKPASPSTSRCSIRPTSWKAAKMGVGSTIGGQAPTFRLSLDLHWPRLTLRSLAARAFRRTGNA